MLDSNLFRRCWDFVVFLLLVYTATILPFRMCFFEFRIPTAHPYNKQWIQCEYPMEALFIVDLVINFFFSYHDEEGNEVTDLRRIARRYLSSYFVLNFIACVPFDVFESEDDSHSHINRSLRLSRLQRLSRLMRLLRLMRIAKLVRMVNTTTIVRDLMSHRGVRIINFAGALTFSVHIFACLWYACAALHQDYEETWVWRREVWSGKQMVPLTEKGPLQQWGNAMYFVLTVFTTVGFGDISALTLAEIAYVCIAMLCGAVVNSIILSHVIDVLTSVDQKARDVGDQLQVVADFAVHAELSPNIRDEISQWVSGGKSASVGFDRKKMKELLTNGALPRKFISRLPKAIFKGELYQNSFVQISSCFYAHGIPSRLPLLIALDARMRYFDAKEVVYNLGDHGWTVFFVLHGTFADIGHPTNEGGIAELPIANSPVTEGEWDDDEVLASPYRLFGRRSYFGEAEVVLNRTPWRCTYARCESGGCLLGLAKQHVLELMEVFPQAATAWRSAAIRREQQRRRLLQELRSAWDYKYLACQTIQRFIRQRVLHESEGLATDVPLALRGPVRPERGFLPQTVVELSVRLDARIDGLSAEMQNVKAILQDIRWTLSKSGSHVRL